MNNKNVNPRAPMNKTKFGTIARQYIDIQKFDDQ